jgi:hypothetical protein
MVKFEPREDCKIVGKTCDDCRNTVTCVHHFEHITITDPNRLFFMNRYKKGRR